MLTAALKLKDSMKMVKYLANHLEGFECIDGITWENYPKDLQSRYNKLFSFVVNEIYAKENNGFYMDETESKKQQLELKKRFQKHIANLVSYKAQKNSPKRLKK